MAKWAMLSAWGRFDRAKTPEGKARQAEGRRRYLARLKTAGLKRPRSGGRKAGKGWITDRMLERARGDESGRLGGWSGLAMDNKLVLTLLKSGDYQEFRVWPERFEPHAIARVKRSPNRMANWALASDHSRAGMVHSFSDRFKTRNSNFVAASSVGKCPLMRTALRSFEFSASIALVV
jgi:hypothetical protein